MSEVTAAKKIQSCFLRMKLRKINEKNKILSFQDALLALTKWGEV